jgi:hypothetical protein
MSEDSKEPSAAKGISRREFARRAALASAVAAVAPAAAMSAPEALSHEHANVAAAACPDPVGDYRGRLPEPASNTIPEQQPTDLPKLSPESHTEVEARLQTILSQYAGRFNDAQKADIHRLCNLVQPPLDRLRAYALENGDGPALYLKPLVEREKNPLENTRVGKTPSATAKP